MKKLAILFISFGIMAALASNFLLYRAARISGYGGIYDLTRLSFVILLIVILAVYAMRRSKVATYALMASGAWALLLLGISVVTGFRIGQSIYHRPEAVRILFDNLVWWSDSLWIASWVFQAAALWPLFSHFRTTSRRKLTPQ
jgi:hypothetical protein